MNSPRLMGWLPMRSLGGTGRVAALLVVLGAGLGAGVGADLGVVRAEEPAGGKLPAPYFRAGDLALLSQAVLPEGWKIAAEGGAAAEKLGTGVRETLAAAKVEPGRVSAFVTALAGPAGVDAALALVDTDPLLTPGGPAPVATLLEAAAATQGWKVQAIGGPAIAFVLMAPSESSEALTAAAMAWGAEGLVSRAQRIAQNGDPLVALATLEFAVGLDARCPSAHLLAGNVRLSLAFQKQPQGSLDRALEHFNAALKAGSPYPLQAQARRFALTQKGTALLLMGKAEVAYAVYQELLADPAFAADDERWGTLYNAACAAAKVGKLDEAFQRLGSVLEHDAQDAVEGIDHWREDTDFAALKTDPRWKALLEKYPAE